MSKSQHAVTDGMILSLATNVLQQVEFRAKAFGPGLCRTDVTLKGSKTIVIPAAPLKWSKWFKTSMAYTGGSHRVSIEELCSSGAMVEARYDSQ